MGWNPRLTGKNMQWRKEGRRSRGQPGPVHFLDGGGEGNGSCVWRGTLASSMSAGKMRDPPVSKDWKTELHIPFPPTQAWGASEVPRPNSIHLEVGSTTKSPLRTGLNPGPTLHLHVCACSIIQSCPTVCDPMNSNPPSSSVHGIFEAKLLEWITISTLRYPSDPGTQPASLVCPALAGGFFTTLPPENPTAAFSPTAGVGPEHRS